MKLDAAFKRRCEAIAVDCRHQLALRSYDPLYADQMLAVLHGNAVTPDRIPKASPEAVHHLMTHDDWSAGIIRPHPLLIVYHPAHPPARYQSNLMHEIAHVLLDHPMIGFDSETGLPLRAERYEDEATYLGSCLQIPRLGLQWIAAQGYDEQEIATYFGASVLLVRFRSNMTRIALPH